LILVIPCRFWMSAITAYDDAPDDDEDTDGEQQMDPPRSIEHECANCPDDDQRYSYDDAEIHDLTGCAMAFQLRL
jgi:hypothetical protein